MFMKPRGDVQTVSEARTVGSATRWVVGLATVVLLILGVFPNALVHLTQQPGSYLHASTPQVTEVMKR
jgi:hypothetical protein